MALALSLFAPAASATGQEMAGLAVYLAAAVSLMAGLAIGAVVVAIILMVTWISGSLRRNPWRIAAVCTATLVSGPILVFLGFVVQATIADMQKYPAQYPWLTGVRLESPETQQRSYDPPEPQRDFVTAARDRLGLLAQDVVRWWYYDEDVEDAERRASGGN